MAPESLCKNFDTLTYYLHIQMDSRYPAADPATNAAMSLGLIDLTAVLMAQSH